MELTIKIATRSRGWGFLKHYTDNIVRSGTDFIFAYDDDDNSVINPPSFGTHFKGKRVSKIEAVNRGLNETEWDILLMGSDDMIPLIKGFDELILNEWKYHFKESTNGLLWLNDSEQKRIVTCGVIGREYFNKYGYYYHPSYVSLWSDNEQTDVAFRDGVLRQSKVRVIEHRHPANVKGVVYDNLYKENDKFWTQDHNNYLNRKKLNFPK